MLTGLTETKPVHNPVAVQNLIAEHKVHEADQDTSITTRRFGEQEAIVSITFYKLCLVVLNSKE